MLRRVRAFLRSRLDPAPSPTLGSTPAAPDDIIGAYSITGLQSSYGARFPKRGRPQKEGAASQNGCQATAETGAAETGARQPFSLSKRVLKTGARQPFTMGQCLSFSQIEHRQIQVNGLDMHVATAGDGPPVLFKQRRVGRSGVVFNMIKFRTMIRGADQQGSPWTTNDDARITRRGRLLRRTALDELPSIISIWKGEMSLVGPRALSVTEQRFLESTIPGFERRLLPGGQRRP